MDWAESRSMLRPRIEDSATTAATLDSRRPRLSGVLPHALIVASVLAVYANTLSGGFVFDDHFYLGVASRSRTPADLVSLFTRPFTLDQDITGVQTQAYRPVWFVYGALAYRLWGARAWPWHAANIAIHALTACLVLVALRRLFALPPGAALLACLLWAVHPVNVAAIAWGAPAVYAMMGGFLLVAVLVACGWWPVAWPWPVRALVAAGAFALSVLSHELGLMAPVLAALALAAAPGVGRGWRHPLDRSALAPVVAMGVTALAYLVLRFTLIDTGQAGEIKGMAGNLGSRLLQAPEILLRYLALLAFPARLTMDRSQDIPVPSGPLDSRLIVAIGLCAILIWSAARAARRVPALAFGGTWFLVAYFPTSNTLIPLYSVMGEQYIYIASVGIVAGGLAAAREAARAWGVPRVAALVGIGLVVAYGARSLVRVEDWHDDFTFNLATVAASPRSALFHTNLGNSYFSRGQPSLAEKEYRIALELNPAAPKAHYNLGTLVMSLGRLDEAEASFRRAIALRQDYAEAYYNLAVVAHRQGREQDAIHWLERASALAPGNAETDLLLGLTFLGVDPDRAPKHLQRFLAAAPDHPQASAVRAILEKLSQPAR